MIPLLILCAALLSRARAAELELSAGAELLPERELQAARIGAFVDLPDERPLTLGAVLAASPPRRAPTEAHIGLVEFAYLYAGEPVFQIPYLDRRLSLDLVAGIRAPDPAPAAWSGGPYVNAGLGLMIAERSAAVPSPANTPPVALSPRQREVLPALVGEAGFGGWFGPHLGVRIGLCTHISVAERGSYRVGEPAGGRGVLVEPTLAASLRVRR